MLTRLNRDLTICPNLPIGATVTQFLSRASGLMELIEAKRSSQKGKIWSNLYGEYAGYMFQTCKNQNILQMFNAFFCIKSGLCSYSNLFRSLFLSVQYVNRGSGIEATRSHYLTQWSYTSPTHYTPAGLNVSTGQRVTLYSNYSELIYWNLDM